MTFWMGSTAFLALLSAASPSAAQPPAPISTPVSAPVSQGDVVVTARKAAERQREAREFVRGVSATPIDGQMARWHTPLCLAVTGIAPDLAAHVADRVRAVARDAGAAVGGPGCRPNAFVTFTTDAHGLLAAMERRQPPLLRDLALPEARALRASLAPVLWWNGTQTEGADGRPLSSTPSVAVGPNSPLPENDHTRYIDRYTSSLVSTAIRVSIENAVVLIDVTRGTGRRLDAVADYAAFAILARVRPAAPHGTAPTILKLFTADADARPRGLTPSDRAYLAALYRIAPDRVAATQVGQIVGAVGGGR